MKIEHLAVLIEDMQARLDAVIENMYPEIALNKEAFSVQSEITGRLLLDMKLVKNWLQEHEARIITLEAK